MNQAGEYYGKSIKKTGRCNDEHDKIQTALGSQK